MRNLAERIAIAAAVTYFSVSVGLAVSSFAAVDTTFPSSSGAVDPIARSQIEHLREMLAAAEKLNDQRFRNVESNISTALAANQSALSAALQAVKEAGLKQETAVEKRLESVNEFRGQLKDQAATFVTRAELWAAVTTTLMIGIAFVGVYQKWQSKKEQP